MSSPCQNGEKKVKNLLSTESHSLVSVLQFAAEFQCSSFLGLVTWSKWVCTFSFFGIKRGYFVYTGKCIATFHDRNNHVNKLSWHVNVFVANDEAGSFQANDFTFR